MLQLCYRFLFPSYIVFVILFVFIFCCCAFHFFALLLQNEDTRAKRIEDRQLWLL